MLRRIAIAAAVLLVAVMPVLARPTHHHRHPHRTHQATRATAAQSITVWVNTDSGVYHYPGQRWYGNTNQGQYMGEDAAVKAGYRGTRNGQ